MKRRIGFFSILLAILYVSYSCSSAKKEWNGLTPEEIKVSSLVIEAATQKEIGNTDKAIMLYDSVLLLDPDNSLAYYQLAALHFENLDVDKAVKSNIKAMELNPENNWYRQQLAEIYIMTRQFDNAEKQYEILAKQNPGKEEYQQLLIECYLQTQNTNKLIDYLNRLEKKYGTNKNFTQLKYRLYKEMNRKDKAANELKRFVKQYPNDVEMLSILAQMAMQNKEYDSAFDYFTRIERINPEDDNNIIALVEYFEKTDQWDKCEEYIDKFCQSKTTDFDSKNMILLRLYADKLEKDSVTMQRYLGHLESMQQLHSDQENLWRSLNVTYMLRSDMPKAAFAAEQAISLGVKDFQIYVNLLFAQNTMEIPDSVILTADTMIELFPDQPIPYLFKGVNQAILSRKQEAIATLEKGLSLSGNNKALEEDFCLNLADVYHENEQSAQSFEYYERVIKLNPNNTIALNNYAYYLSLEDRELDKAEEMAEKAYTTASDNMTFADTYAWVLYKKGLYSKAKQILDRFIDKKDEWSQTISQHYESILQALEKQQR